MNPYTKLPGLDCIVLEESFVLDIEAHPGSVTFFMEFVLTPEHPAYSAPRAGERYSFHRGSLQFGGVEHLTWVGQGAPPAIDASDEIDYGHIDTFEWDAVGYRIEGSWGRIELRSDVPEVVLG